MATPVAVSRFEVKSHDAPDETRAPSKTRIEVVRLEGYTLARFNFEPGWRWSECIKPVVGTDSCQVEHIRLRGVRQLHVTHEDGTEGEAKSGDVYRIAPGHDARVVGEEPAVFVEFQGAANYAKG